MAAPDVNEVPKAWLIRTGKYGERDHIAIENGLSGGGWTLPDLTAVTTREEFGGKRIGAQSQMSPKGESPLRRCGGTITPTPNL